MALKRTKCLGWTKKMSNTRRLVHKMYQSGDISNANELNDANNHSHADNKDHIRERTYLRRIGTRPLSRFVQPRQNPCGEFI